MDLRKLILDNLTVQEIESLLSEKKKAVQKPSDSSREDYWRNYLLKNVLKYKNPLIK